MRYPTLDDIDMLRACGCDDDTLQAQMRLVRRGIQAEALKASIREAFGGVGLGRGIGLYEARGLDDYDEPQGCPVSVPADERNDWQAIPVSRISELHGCLHFFDAESMRFHLPAFMMADIDGEYGWNLAYWITRFGEDVFSLLNETQRNAVSQYLRFIMDEPEYAVERRRISAALGSGWSR